MSGSASFSIKVLKTKSHSNQKQRELENYYVNDDLPCQHACQHNQVQNVVKGASIKRASVNIIKTTHY